MIYTKNDASKYHIHYSSVTKWYETLCFTNKDNVFINAFRVIFYQRLNLLATHTVFMFNWLFSWESVKTNNIEWNIKV